MNIPSYKLTKDYRVYLLDIIEAIERITEYTQGVDEARFSQEIQLQDAVIRRFHIIGEAASNVPDIIRGEHPNIPWKKIVAQRNLIIHDYASVRPQEIWRVVIEDLPQLLPQMRTVLVVLEKKMSKK